MTRGLVPNSLALSDDNSRLECTCEIDGILHLVGAERLTDADLDAQLAALCKAASGDGVTWSCSRTLGSCRLTRTERMAHLDGVTSRHWVGDLRETVARLSTEIEEITGLRSIAKDEAI